jgi:hypothetical protein
VEAVAAYGIPADDISRVVGVDERQRDGADRRLETRARWKEQPTELSHSGVVAQIDAADTSGTALQLLHARLDAYRERLQSNFHRLCAAFLRWRQIDARTV